MKTLTGLLLVWAADLVALVLMGATFVACVILTVATYAVLFASASFSFLAKSTAWTMASLETLMCIGICTFVCATIWLLRRMVIAELRAQ